MNKEKLTDFLSNLAYSFTLSFRASPKYFIGKCLLLIVNSVFPFLTALAWRNLLNDLTAHNSITSYVIMLVIVYVGLNIIEHFKGMLDAARNVLLRRDRDLSGRYYDIKAVPR